MKTDDLVLYQVCVDRTGDAPFDGTGELYDDKGRALDHLEETRQTRPYAYLATVTYQRCDDERIETVPREPVEETGTGADETETRTAEEMTDHQEPVSVS